MSQISDASVAADFRSHIKFWLRGTLEDLAELADVILEGKRTGWPYLASVELLAEEPTRRLWRALDDYALQSLYDVAAEGGLADAADALAEAILKRPFVDDGRIPREVRELVMQRDGGRCQTCGETENLTIDHKWIAWSDGGSSRDPDALQVLCRPCNSRKGVRPWSEEA